MHGDGLDSYVSDLAEGLSPAWSKLGAQISCWDADTINGPDSADPAQAAAFQSQSDGRPVPFTTGAGARGVAVPVFGHGRCLGGLVCRLPASLAEQAPALFDIFIQYLDKVQANFRKENELTAMSRELAGSYEALSLIYRLGEHFQFTDDPGRFLAHFADDLLELIHAQGLLLLVHQPAHGPETCLQAGKLPIGNAAAQAVGRYLRQLGHGNSLWEPIILADLSAHPALVQLFKTTQVGILAWPVQANGTPLGILVAVSMDQTDVFDSTDAKLLGSIAEHAASFLQNRFLLADIQELLTGLLTSLVNAIDAKDPYTRGHSQRVALIGRRIAEALGLSNKECAQLYMAGLLHDIGKIGIDDQVLAKPGKLTPEEFATVQQHPVIGSRIISSVRQLRAILPGVLHHHERYDGQGYCEGLTGPQIPRMGMIVGLADCFDAITSERTYHSAMSFQDALREVTQCAGKQFDPTIVQGLLDCDLAQLERDLHTLAETHQSPVLPSLNWIE